MTLYSLSPMKSVNLELIVFGRFTAMFCHAKITHLFVDIVVVIAWQLCKMTKVDEVKNLALGLNDCLKEHKNVNLESVFLDDCCHWRKKIESIFGKVPVKLDCFHTTHWFVSTLSMKNVTAQLDILRNQMIRSFKIVSRFVRVQIQGKNDRK